MRMLFIGLIALGALALSTPNASAKHGWGNLHGAWHGGAHRQDRYVFKGRGNHYGWYKGRGNPHRYW